MTEPIRIHCPCVSKIPAVEQLRAMADCDHHVVLQFPVTQHVDKSGVIGKLAAAMPEHSVFDSGGNRTSDWVTVMPVVARATVIAHTQEIKRAVAAYIETCSTLLAHYAGKGLSAEWTSYEHGEHRRFENSVTGQVVEAPLGGAPEPQKVDPFFFAFFVKSTPGFEVVARLIRHDFHDAARIRDIVFGEDRNAEPDAKG